MSALAIYHSSRQLLRGASTIRDAGFHGQVKDYTVPYRLDAAIKILNSSAPASQACWVNHCLSKARQRSFKIEELHPVQSRIHLQDSNLPVGIVHESILIISGHAKLDW
jgi:hypothetical protein